MPTEFIVKGNRILALLIIIFKAHVELANNTIGHYLFPVALMDIANQSLGLGAFSLSLHSLLKESNEKDFKDSLSIALRFVEKFKEVQSIELMSNDIKKAINEIESLVVDLKETVVIA